jgi:hypothetical protein
MDTPHVRLCVPDAKRVRGILHGLTGSATVANSSARRAWSGCLRVQSLTPSAPQGQQVSQVLQEKRYGSSGNHNGQGVLGISILREYAQAFLACLRAGDVCASSGRYVHSNRKEFIELLHGCGRNDTDRPTDRTRPRQFELRLRGKPRRSYFAR